MVLGDDKEGESLVLIFQKAIIKKLILFTCCHCFFFFCCWPYPVLCTLCMINKLLLSVAQSHMTCLSSLWFIEIWAELKRMWTLNPLWGWIPERQHRPDNVIGMNMKSCAAEMAKTWLNIFLTFNFNWHIIVYTSGIPHEISIHVL